MKFKKTVIFGLVCLITICSARPADEDYADYAEPAPAPKAPARHSALLNRRNPLTRNAAAKPTSTTTTAAPVEEEEEEVPEEEVEEIPVEPSSTTEAPKKLKGGIVRPFRSNDDLLAALKRRREQAAINKSQQPKTTPAPAAAEESAAAEPAPSKSRVSGKRRFNSKNDAAPQEQHNQEQSATNARTGRRFNARS